MTNALTPGTPSPFEQIRRTNDAGNEYWSSRDFARVLGYSDYRNFEAVVEKARTACFNSGQRVDDHFVEITDMIEVGKGAMRLVCLRTERQNTSSPSPSSSSMSAPSTTSASPSINLLCCRRARS